ncbi:hypothetical protein C804_03360 [Lachnospiraceae bacterium A4]|nr:hypothetical protein C804_03360 [Lachnospiraceae bacterium A4]
MGSVNGVGNVFCPFNLGAEGIKQLFYFPIDAFGELDLLHYLVCTIIQLLFGGDDAEQVQDKCQQKHRYEDEHHRIETALITILAFHYGCQVPAGYFGNNVGIAFGNVRPPLFCCTRYSMDAFTGKERNRANAVLMLYQFLLTPKKQADLGN